MHYLIFAINCNLRDRVSQPEDKRLSSSVAIYLFSSLFHLKYSYNMPVAKIAPSMLSCDFAYLAAEAKRMEKNGADWLHLGNFTFYYVRVLKILIIYLF